MARKNMIDDGSYQEKQMGKAKGRFEQEKPKQISGKEKEDLDSLAAAIEGKKYLKGMYDDIDHYAGEPARFVKGKKSKKMSKPVTSEEENIEYPTRERQTLESILPKPLGEE